MVIVSETCVVGVAINVIVPSANKIPEAPVEIIAPSTVNGGIPGTTVFPLIMMFCWIHDEMYQC